MPLNTSYTGLSTNPITGYSNSVLEKVRVMHFMYKIAVGMVEKNIMRCILGLPLDY